MIKTLGEIGTRQNTHWIPVITPLSFLPQMAGWGGSKDFEFRERCSVGHDPANEGAAKGGITATSP